LCIVQIALQRARQAKGLSQKDLAQKLNVKPSIISDYETGKAIPNGALISQLNRTLGVTLPKIPKKKAGSSSSSSDD
jgi:putative transcription factor